MCGLALAPLPNPQGISTLEVQRHYVTVDGVKLAYEEYGQGPPVVFVHGFPASSYSWRYAAQALADRGGLTFVGFYLSAAALISFLALYAELVVIRWLASEVRVFAYFKNLPTQSNLAGHGNLFSNRLI